MNDPFIYGLLIVLFLIFQLLRSAFNSVNKLKLELDKAKAGYSSGALNYISKNTQDFVITADIYYFIILILFISISKNQFVLISHSENYSLLLITHIAILALIILSIIFSRTLGEYFPNELINLLAVPIIILYIICYPFTKTLRFLTRSHIKLIHRDNIETEPKKFDKEDLNKLVSDNQKHRSQNERLDSEIKLFKNALEFSEIKIRECMIPRTEIVAIELNDLSKDLLTGFIKTGLSKIIVFRDSIDNIVGYVKSKSLLSSDKNYRKKIKNISIFPESMPVNKLLRYFIKAGQNIAVIVDEFGGTSGIITIEDILEEIFGEIKDEHDTEDLYEQKLNEKDYVFSGRLEIDFINEKYNLGIPVNEEYETIAGFILHYNENIPKINDHITIQNYSIRILKVSDTRVELVKLEILGENL
ncbi:MAG: hemolysin family protein [Bacteroidales bacterium]|nr:hemolysin family protein [Bacteroidales bacterium]